MIIIGLTGSIGMGKSTCGKMLQDLDVPVHESDLSVHDLLSNDTHTQKEIIKAFPDLSLPIDRKALGEIIFHDDHKRKKLESILHPKVQNAQKDFINQQAKNGKNIVALDIPLLYETDAEKRTDYVMVVSAPFDVQKQRVLSRPHMSDDKFNAIIAKQLSDEEKRKRANFIIPTGGDKSETFTALKNALVQIKKDHQISC